MTLTARVALPPQCDGRRPQAERLVASSQGLAADTPFMADLDDEIAEVSDAYVGAAVTEIAPLRAELVRAADGLMTHTTSQFELSVPLRYIETTIPAGMTIDEYRRSRPQRRSRWHSLRRRARG